MSPCRSRMADTCTTEVADQVRVLSGSVAFTCGWMGEISWSPGEAERERDERGRAQIVEIN